MINFLQEYWLFLTVVLGTILIIVTVYTIFSWRNRKLFPKTQPTEKKVPFPTKEAKILSIVNSEKDLDEDTLQTVSEVVDPETPVKDEVVINVSPTEKPIPILDEIPVVADENSFDDDDDSVLDSDGEPIIEDFDDTSEKKEFGAFHVIFRKIDQKWIIKREGSKKIYRTLDTQKEAIAYAIIKSIVQDTTFVIHKKDGKIRKQKYYKK